MRKPCALRAPQPLWPKCKSKREPPIEGPTDRICFLLFLMIYLAFKKDNMANDGVGGAWARRCIQEVAISSMDIIDLGAYGSGMTCISY